jgi:hypothetical protein
MAAVPRDIIEAIRARRIRSDRLYYSGPSKAETAAGVTPVDTSYSADPHDIRRYGAVMDGVTDDSAAFAKLALVMGQGGNGYLPPLPMMLKSTTTLALPIQKRLTLSGYGCTIFTTGAIDALKVTGAGLGGADIRGITFDNSTDSLATAGVNLFGAIHCRVIDCWNRISSTIASSASYAMVVIQPSDPTDNNTGAFWNKVIRCGWRQTSGNASFYAPYGVLILGTSNASSVEQCSFTSVTNAVGIESQSGGGATGDLANGIVVAGNAFEGATNAVECNFAAGKTISGLRVLDNRVEAVTTFLALQNATVDIGGTWPPLLQGNYLISSVTNYILQTGAFTTSVVNSMDAGITPAFSGTGGGGYMLNQLGWTISAVNSNDAIRCRASTTFGLAFEGPTGVEQGFIRNRSGSGISIGSSLAVDMSAIVGLSGTTTAAKNFRGTATFATAATVAVSFGTAEPNVTYQVFIGAQANETFWVTAKATSGFTINSSNATSTAVVSWLLIR